MLPIFGLVLYWALQVFVIALWARFIIDLIRVTRQGWRPRGFWLVLFSAIYVFTDPPIKVVRRFVKPVRIGMASIDFAWTIVLIAAIILMSVATALTRVQ